MTMPAQVRVLGLLNGNIRNERGQAFIKYGQLFAHVAQHCNLIDVHNVEVQRTARYFNAIQSFRLPRERWREASYKNVWVFEQRRQRAQAAVRRYQHEIDVVLQHSATFSSHLTDGGPPITIYTDFTYRLTQREDRWRDPFTNDRQREHWNQLETEAYHHAAFVFTRSEYARQSLLIDYQLPPDRVIVVGGGVNFAALPPIIERPIAPRILFIGKHFDRKGGPQLVAAFRRVRERIPTAELWLVTSEVTIREPGVVQIEPTHNRDTIHELYRSASLFAMPSRCETWGDVFLEAMAHQLPCIGTTNDAMPEIIEHGVTGYVVPPDDVDALAQYLEQLLAQPDLCAAMGTRGRERLERQFTWDHVVRRMMPYLELTRSETLVSSPSAAL